jgi:hypothetical protein
VLGDEQGLSERLRTDFRASGLYHLLSRSRVSTSQPRRRWRAERTTRTQPRVGTAGGRGSSNRSRPPARASRGRSD